MKPQQDDAIRCKFLHTDFIYIHGLLINIYDKEGVQIGHLQL